MHIFAGITSIADVFDALKKDRFIKKPGILIKE